MIGAQIARGRAPLVHGRSSVTRIVAVAALALALLAVSPPAGALPEGTRVQVYERGLDELPVDMAWVPRTRKIFFTEKSSGRIRVMRGRRLLPEPCADLRVENEGERGALGIALDPDYPTNHYLYVYFSSAARGDNRVVRFTVEGNRCTNRFLVISGIPAGNRHNGGQLEFMDGHLFIATGEIGEPELAQDLDSTAGKILRILPDGDIPADNPFETNGSPNEVWSYGHRNAFGFAVKPDTSQLYESENGPQCQDELNFIVRGANYGWGPGFLDNCRGDPDGEDPREPLRRWTPTIAPTDLAWYEGRLAGFDRSLLMGAFNDGKIRRFYLTPDGESIASGGPVYNGSKPVMDVAKGPGGWVYFLTSNAIKRIVAE